jgi:hypothetical protein
VTFEQLALQVASHVLLAAATRQVVDVISSSLLSI